MLRRAPIVVGVIGVFLACALAKAQDDPEDMTDEERDSVEDARSSDDFAGLGRTEKLTLNRKPPSAKGQVTMTDGSPPPEKVLVRMECGGGATAEGYTARDGSFSLEISGADLQVWNRNVAGDNDVPVTESCTLRAILSGYHSVSQGTTLVLVPVKPSEGVMVSATGLAAPKQARQAYDKGIQDLRKKKFADAEKDFRKAVEICPNYADAWQGLGVLLQDQARNAESREAFEKAIAADARLVKPYMQLAVFATADKNWPEVAELTDTVLRLNPYDFPQALYLNATAYFLLANYSRSADSAARFIEIDPGNKLPMARYFLGASLAFTGNLAEASDALRTFLQIAPSSPNAPLAQRLLNEVSLRQSAQATAHPAEAAKFQLVEEPTR